MNYKISYIICLFLSCSIIFSQCEEYIYGDANNDNSLDIIDVIIFVDVVFGTYSIETELIDLNFDSLINIFDIIILIERILDDFPQEINILEVDFNFHQLEIAWEISQDYGFYEYNLYYSNFINNQENLLYSTNNITDTSVIIEDVILNELNYFWINITDFTGCTLTGSQYIYELPYKNITIE